tara:strand:+ start:562 stop:1077 length:516 start_codon:yes stop_codon:yes gene_type:complete
MTQDEFIEESYYHMHEELILELTRNEALFLDDSFTLMIEKEKDDHIITSMRPVQNTAGLAVPLDLMDKVGRAIVYTTHTDNQGKVYKLPVEISEIFMIREIAQSFIKVGDEPVGYNLKRKVCELLYAEDLEQENREERLTKLLKDIDVELETSILDEVPDSELTNTRDGEV